ncbi:unnamed protein product [Choristocarpus tenellus]
MKLLWLVLALLLINTSRSSVAPTANLLTCVTDYDETANVDYFPEKATITRAETFSVEYFNSYKVLTVSDDFAQSTYILYQCGTPQPVVANTTAYIEVPVSNISTGSSSHIPYIELLDERESIVAFHGNSSIIGSPCVDEMVASGLVVDASYVNEECPSFPIANNEVLEEMRVQVSFGDGNPAVIYCGSSILSLYNGVGVVSYAEKGDEPSLKEAEAIKLFSLFYNKETIATEAYEQVVELWDCTATNAQGCSLQLDDVPDVAWFPYVPTLAAYGDFASGWGAPVNGTYYDDAITKAGGRMIPCESTSQYALLTDEDMLACFMDAEICVFSANFDLVKEVMAEEVWGALECVKKGNVYDIYLNDNSWFEAKAVEPHVLLEDLIVVLHGEETNYGIGNYERLLLRHVATEEVNSGSYFVNKGVCDDISAPLEIQGECTLIIDFTTCETSSAARPSPLDLSASALAVSIVLAAATVSITAFLA